MTGQARAGLRRRARATAPRVLGAVTTLYSAAIVVQPAILAKPCRMTAPGGAVPRDVRTLIAAIGARDTALGVAMLLAPPGPALRAVLACRAVADASDAVIFGARLPDRQARLRIGGFAAMWATLCAVAAWDAGGDRARS